MSINFDVTGTKFLKVTVTKDNDIRFKVPKNEQEYYPFEVLERFANQILEIPLITEHQFTVRGKLMEDGIKIPFYDGSGSSKRTHIYTVFYRG